MYSGGGTGLSIAEYGSTHYITEDLALIRMCPGIDTYSVSDILLAEWLGENFLDFTRPCYIRFDKLITEDRLIESEDKNYKTGIRFIKNADSDKLVISTGNIGYEALKFIKEHKTRNYDFIDIYKFPYDDKTLIGILQKYSDIVVIDESNIENSLYTLILKDMNKYGVFKHIKNYALDFSKGFPKVYGSRDYLLKNNGLDFWKELF